MKIFFDEKNMDKNIEFLRKINDLNLEKKVQWFDNLEKTKRVPNKEITLEEFIQFIHKSNFFHNSLSILEHELTPFNYCIRINKTQESDLFYWIQCDLTNDNFVKIQNLYHEVFGRYLQEDDVSRKG